jgi:hypothetical protein
MERVPRPGRHVYSDSALLGKTSYQSPWSGDTWVRARMTLTAGIRFQVGGVTTNIDLDVFNLFNSATVLQRRYDYRLTGATGFNQPLEIMNPRIARIGVRLEFQVFHRHRGCRPRPCQSKDLESGSSPGDS